MKRVLFALMQGPGILFERLKETITIIKHHNRSPRYELRTSKFEEQLLATAPQPYFLNIYFKFVQKARRNSSGNEYFRFLICFSFRTFISSLLSRIPFSFLLSVHPKANRFHLSSLSLFPSCFQTSLPVSIQQGYVLRTTLFVHSNKHFSSFNFIFWGARKHGNMKLSFI